MDQQITNQPESPKKQIQRIYNEQNVKIRATNTVANMINKQIKEVLHGAHHFIHELLQNSDDDNATEVSFTVSKNKLTLSHNGDGFDTHDIERICDCARGNDTAVSTKSKKNNKIGYKGVGFKAVFKYSEQIKIKSNEYFFKFSKQHIENERNPGDETSYPWQIMPIWNKTQEDSNDGKTSILLENISETDIMEISFELMKLKKTPEICLFLQSINKINIETENAKFSIIKSLKKSEQVKVDMERLINVSISGASGYSQLWYVYSVKIEIPEIIKEYLSNNEDYPPRLQSARTTLITFAVRYCIQDKNFQCDSSVLYCYLPTLMKSNLPFILNASFKLDQKRGEIINNQWNHFLIESAAESHFKLLAKISKNERFRSRVLDLLVMPQNIDKCFAQSTWNDCFKKGFKRGLKTQPCMLTLENDLVKLDEVVIDLTKFYHQFYGDIRDGGQGNSDEKIRYILHPNILHNSIFLDFIKQVSKITWQILSEKVEFLITTVRFDVQIKMLKYIINNAEDISIYKNKKIIKSKNKEAKYFCASEGFYTSAVEHKLNKKLKMIPFGKFLLIASCDYTNEDMQLISEKMNILSFNEKNILIRYIPLLFDECNKNEDSSKKVLHYIYRQFFTNNTGSFADWIKNNSDAKNIILSLPVRTKTGKLQPLRECIVMINRDEYSEYDDSLYLDRDFYENIGDKMSWVNLYQTVSVQQKVSIKIFPSISIAELSKLYGIADKLNEYLKGEIKRGPHFPNNIKYDSVIDNIIARSSVFNFAMCEILFNNNIPLNIRINAFISAVSEGEAALCSIAEIQRTIRTSLEELSEQFLFFYWRNVIKVPVYGHHNKKESATKLLYCPKLKELLKPGDSVLNNIMIADVQNGLTLDHAYLLGFKLYPKNVDLLKLLTNVNKCFENIPGSDEHLNQLSILYRLLIENHDKPSGAQLSEWKKDANLLTCDKKLIRTDDVKIGAKNNTVNFSNCLHDVGFDYSEINKLANILELKVFDPVQCYGIENESPNPKEEYKEFVIETLPYFALKLSPKFNKSESDILKILYDSVSLMEFYECDEFYFQNERLYLVSFIKENKFLFRIRNRNDTGKIINPLKSYFFSKLGTFEERIFNGCMNCFPVKTELKSYITEELNGDLKEYNALLDYLNQLMKDNLSPKDYDFSKSPSDNHEDSPLMQFDNTNNDSVSAGNRKEDSTNNEYPDINTPTSSGQEPSINYQPQTFVQRTLPPLENGPNVKQIESKKSLEKNKTESQLDYDELIRIGIKGEFLVYNKIKTMIEKQFENSFEACILNEQPGVKYTVGQEKHVIELIWYNLNSKIQKNVSKEPIDLLIKINDNEAYFIEVKSTKQPRGNEKFFLSANEFTYFSMKNKYILIRVYDVDGEKPYIASFKNPLNMLANNLLRLCSNDRVEFEITCSETCDLGDSNLSGYKDDITGCRIN